MTHKLIAFDMDGTLLTDESSWWKLHRYFRTRKLSLKNMRAYEQGKIAYDEFMRLDVALWKPRPHINTIKKILLDYNFTPYAENVTNILRKRKYRIVLITTGLDILANEVASKLRIPYVLANGLVFDENGFVTRNVIFRVDLFRKERALNGLIAKIGVQGKECIAVGDSKYDASFLRSAGLGIAFNPDRELRSIADAVITDMRELLDFV